MTFDFTYLMAVLYFTGVKAEGQNLLKIFERSKNLFERRPILASIYTDLF
jgi:hypothetical protein